MMMRLSPGYLRGELTIQASKSQAHRVLVAAALSAGESVISNIHDSEDILATQDCLSALGFAVFRRDTSGRLHVRPLRTPLTNSGSDCPAISSAAAADGVHQAPLFAPCRESGSTLRFLIPLALLLGRPVLFTGQGRLLQRPLQTYVDLFAPLGVTFTPLTEKNSISAQGSALLTAESRVLTAKGAVAAGGESVPAGGAGLLVRGTLGPGLFSLPGNISSQFITGLLFALPCLDGDSVIELTTPLESKSYVDLTLEALALAGIAVSREGDRVFHVPGRQRYQPRSVTLEGDWSHAAFFLTAGALGGDLLCRGLNLASRQGDRQIVALLRQMGAQIVERDDGLQASAAPSSLRPAPLLEIDVAQIPDLVPILTVAACGRRGLTKIVNAGRLRLKESDRLAAIRTELNRIGARVEESSDALFCYGTAPSWPAASPPLAGGACQSHNDHRIAMSLAIATALCRQPLSLSGAEAVRKSAAGFWEDYQRLEVLRTDFFRLER